MMFTEWLRDQTAREDHIGGLARTMWCSQPSDLDDAIAEWQEQSAQLGDIKEEIAETKATYEHMANPSATYRFCRAVGEGTVGDCRVTVVPPGRGIPSEEPLPERLDLANHSPTGFQWGYAGSGPAQLALALCAHVLDDDRQALAVYQNFKLKHLSHEQRDQFALKGTQLMEAMTALLLAESGRS